MSTILARPLVALLLVAIAIASASADAAQKKPIRVVDEQYSTDLSLRTYTTTCAEGTGCKTKVADAARAKSSDHPVSDSLTGSARVNATASASAFNVSASTIAYANYNQNETSAFANAFAESHLTFRTVASGTSALSLQFLARDQAYFTEGFVALYDVTLGQTLFDYSWDWGLSGNVPWLPDLSASISVTQWFDSKHLYSLKMGVGSNANTDSQSASISLTGLHPIAAPVPEPEASALALAGLIAVGAAVFRRKRAAA